MAMGGLTHRLSHICRVENLGWYEASQKWSGADTYTECHAALCLCVVKLPWLPYPIPPLHPQGGEVLHAVCVRSCVRSCVCVCAGLCVCVYMCCHLLPPVNELSIRNGNSGLSSMQNFTVTVTPACASATGAQMLPCIWNTITWSSFICDACFCVMLLDAHQVLVVLGRTDRLLICEHVDCRND